MFNVGDRIIYGSNGVCEVEKIGPLDTPGTDKNKVYYTLSPVYVKGSTIFTPADNEKVIMRPVISKDDALALIDNIKDCNIMWIKEEKKREFQYKEAIRKCDCRELVSIIKTIYMRKQERIAEGKKITAGDEKYFRMAEDSLYGELAISLGMKKEEVKDFIVEHIDEGA